jgi:hypothetical protein
MNWGREAIFPEQSESQVYDGTLDTRSVGEISQSRTEFDTYTWGKHRLDVGQPSPDIINELWVRTRIVSHALAHLCR